MNLTLVSLAAFAILVAGAGCGGSSTRVDAGTFGADGSDAEAALTDPDADAGPRPTACQGSVNVTGQAAQGPNLEIRPFQAAYIYATYQGGDCFERLTLTLADAFESGGTSLTFSLGHVPGSWTFLGDTTPAVQMKTGASTWTVGADVTVTQFALPDDADAAATGVTGTIHIKADSIDVAGTFATPFCEARICI